MAPTWEAVTCDLYSECHALVENVSVLLLEKKGELDVWR